MIIRAAFTGIVAITLLASPAYAQRRGYGACNFSWDDENYFVSPFFRGNPVLRRTRHLRAHQVPRARTSAAAKGRAGRTTIRAPMCTSCASCARSRSIRPFVERGPIIGSALVRLDEPELFKYPIAYLSEPGGWTHERRRARRAAKVHPARRVHHLRRHRGRSESRLPQPARAVEARVSRVASRSVSRTITRSSTASSTSTWRRSRARCAACRAGVSRVLRGQRSEEAHVAIIDNYADIGEFIECSDEGFDVVPANEAYKLWVNYFVYALTH